MGILRKDLFMPHHFWDVMLYGSVFFWTGVITIIQPERLTSDTYDMLREISSAPIWGAAYASLGLAVIISVSFLPYSLVRISISLLSSITAMWAVAYLIAFIVGATPSLAGLIAYTYFTILGFRLVSRDPYPKAIVVKDKRT